MKKEQFVRDLKENDTVSSPFLVKYSAVQTGKTGKPYMNLVLMDKSGEVEARVWDQVQENAALATRDAFVQIDGRCQLFQGRRQIVVKKVQLLREDELEPKDFVQVSDVDPEALYEEVKIFVESMQDPHYKALAQSVLIDDSEIVDRFKIAPAAKTLHHAYRSGLIEHTVSIMKILDFLGSHYDGRVDRDLLFIGGFFHDICKIWELSYERATDYTDEGRLVGHLVMGAEMITKKVALLNAEEGRLPSPFPKEKMLLAKHMVLAHHGKLEYGSPREPQVLEALIVHYVDDMDSKVGSILQFIQKDEMPGKWSGLHRQFNRFFLKPEWAQKSP